MKTTHIRITKESKKILREMAEEREVTAAEILDELIEEEYKNYSRTE